MALDNRFVPISLPVCVSVCVCVCVCVLYRVSLGFTGLYWVLLGLPSYIVLHRMLMGSFSDFPTIIDILYVSIEFTRFYRVM